MSRNTELSQKVERITRRVVERRAKRKAEKRRNLKLTAYVRARGGREQRVDISRWRDLTPRSALAAAEIAFGAGANVTVCAEIDGEDVCYQVSGTGRSRRARRVRARY